MTARLLAATGLLLVACGETDSARVSFDFGPLWQQLAQEASQISVRVFDYDNNLLKTRLLQDFESTLLMDVEAGPRRRFEVEATFLEAALRVPSYYGELYSDLFAGEVADLEVPIFPAGGFRGEVHLPTDSITLPTGTLLIAEAHEPRPDAPASKSFAIEAGAFEGTLPDGEYTFSVELSLAGGISYSGQIDVTIERSAIIDSVIIRLDDN